MRSAVVWSTRPGQRFRNSSSVIKGAASNVGCGCVRSRPPGPPADRNHKTRRHPTDSPAEKLPRRSYLEKVGARNAKMLGGYACGEDPLRFDGGCFWHRNHCNRVNFTISISPAAARTREFLNFGLRLRPFGNAQQDPRRVLKCIYSAR